MHWFFMRCGFCHLGFWTELYQNCERKFRLNGLVVTFFVIPYIISYSSSPLITRVGCRWSWRTFCHWIFIPYYQWSCVGAMINVMIIVVVYCKKKVNLVTWWKNVMTMFCIIVIERALVVVLWCYHKGVWISLLMLVSIK